MSKDWMQQFAGVVAGKTFNGRSIMFDAGPNAHLLVRPWVAGCFKEDPKMFSSPLKSVHTAVLCLKNLEFGFAANVMYVHCVPYLQNYGPFELPALETRGVLLK